MAEPFTSEKKVLRLSSFAGEKDCGYQANLCLTIFHWEMGLRFAVQNLNLSQKRGSVFLNPKTNCLFLYIKKCEQVPNTDIFVTQNGNIESDRTRFTIQGVHNVNIRLWFLYPYSAVQSCSQAIEHNYSSVDSKQILLHFMLYTLYIDRYQEVSRADLIL